MRFILMKSALTIGGLVVLLLIGLFALSMLSKDSDFETKDLPNVPSSVVIGPASGNNGAASTPMNSTSSAPVTNVEELPTPPAATQQVREITVDANRFTFTPAAIRAKEGERVKIIVRNIDTTHGVFIPEFDVRGRETVEFVATKKGNYPFYCATYCGSGHPDMQGTIIVE